MVIMDSLKFNDYVLECGNTHWFGKGGKTTIENLLLQCFINNQFGRKQEFFNDMWNLEKFKLKENGYKYYWPNNLNTEYSMKDIDDNNTDVLKSIIKHNGFPKFEQLEEITLKGLFLTMYYSNDKELLEKYNEKILEFHKDYNFPIKYYVFLVDKLDFLKGNLQTYGTFMIVGEDDYKEPLMIKDENSLDERRARLNLLPFEKWKKTREYEMIGERMLLRESWYRIGNKKLKKKN